MPFKIVKSYEKGATVLEIVPDHWEKDGLCWWPKKDLSIKHSDEKCTVDDTFYSIPCKVKRSNLESFSIANEILEVMRNNSSTDDSDLDVSKTKTVLLRKAPNTVTKMNTLPDMTQAILLNQIQQQKQSTPIDQSQDNSNQLTEIPTLPISQYIGSVSAILFNKK